MDCFVFPGVDKDHGDIYTYAKDRDKAIQSLGSRIMDAALPGLSNSVPTTGAEIPNGYLSYQHLLVSGKKKTSCSSDLLQSRESRQKYANDIAVTFRIVDRSKLSPYSFLDSKNIDRLTKSTIDLKPRKRNIIQISEKFLILI